MRRMTLPLAIVVAGILLIGCARTPAITPEPLSDDAVESRARSFVACMAEGKHRDAVEMMDSRMASALPQDRLESTWDTLVSQVGAFKEMTGVRLATESGYRVAYVTCVFEFAAVDTKVVFDVEGRVTGLWFGPPKVTTVEYKDPSYWVADSFAEISVEVGEEPWVLPATLTIPVGEGPFPAVILVHGSGPHDRDETIGPNKPFRDLAGGLAGNGIAVLRYEKRTSHYAQALVGEIDGFTVDEEVVDDAVAAIAYLRQVERVDPDRIFVLGHSLGASLAPRIAETALRTTEEYPAGLIMMAPYARPLTDLVLEQCEYLVGLDGQISAEEAAQLEQVRADVTKIKEGSLEPGELVLGACKAYWDDLLAYDPVAAGRSLGLPMLILQGERDYQVTMEDFAIWQAELKGAAHATLTSLPGLNHLFMFGEGKPSPDEYNEPGDVDQVVISTIAEWVKSIPSSSR